MLNEENKDREIQVWTYRGYNREVKYNASYCNISCYYKIKSILDGHSPKYYSDFHPTPIYHLHRPPVYFALGDNIRVVRGMIKSSPMLVYEGGPNIVFDKNKISLNYKEFESKDKVYIEPFCNIPKKNIEINKVRNKDKADLICIPELKRAYAGFKLVILSSYRNQNYLYDTSACDVGHIEVARGKTICDTFPEYKECMDLLQKNSYIEDFPNMVDYGKSVVTDFFYAFTVDSDNRPLISLFNDAGQDYRYITEGGLIKATMTPEKEFSLDNARDIEAMFSSGDPSNVRLGLNILAEINYVKYKKSVQYLVDKYSRRISGIKPFNTRVAFMIQQLENGCYDVHASLHKKEPYDDADFNILKELLTDELQAEYRSALKEFEREHEYIRIKESHSFEIVKNE